MKGGHLLTILLPISFTISKILTFLYIYYDNKKIRIVFNYGAVIFTIISLSFFYLNINKYGEYFCFIWCGAIIIPIIMYNIMYKSKEKDETNYINKFELFIISISIIWGFFMIIIPHTSIFILIGGKINPYIGKVSTIIFYVYGIVQITLDKPLGIMLKRISNGTKDR
ncbi:MAG: hypothetical protein SOV85_10830 [Clostridium sp.]|uniref:hypothetical protein n=2 Tax=Clostridium TaxID=1485 RepID=UPI002A762240|nr:hypothetical protein [Clostridium sp.]MDY2631826.1 hypothetical protein [Clostridium sp.]